MKRDPPKPDPNSEFLRIVSAAQDATLDLTKWAGVTELVACAMGGHSGALFLHDARTFVPLVIDSWRMNTDTVVPYKEYYHSKDVWYHSGKHLPAGKIATSANLVPREALIASEFYNDLLRKDQIEDLLSCVLIRSQRFNGHLTVLYPARIDAIEPGKLKFITRLVPFLQRSLNVGLRLCDLESQIQVARSALDQVSHGILTVDSTGKILETNRSARRILEADDGLRIQHGKLAAASRLQHAQLVAAIVAARPAGNSHCIAMSAMLAIARPSGKRSYSVAIRPIMRNERQWSGVRAVCAVHITDPEDDFEPPAQWLRRLYGLTLAEARVASALVSGLTLKEYADEAEISMNTARWTLKQVFAKTGTNRQTELVKLLLSGLAGLRIE